jgi:hypothetical protein
MDRYTALTHADDSHDVRGKGYASRHLEHRDYYAEGERVTGRWHGRGATLLGLEGEVNLQDFEAMRQGLDPKTKDYLRPAA